jgi:hypothetical protein
MLIRESLDTVAVAVPVKLTAAFPVEVESVARTYRGLAAKSFIDLQPYATVQRVAVDAAKKWVQHMALQGYELIGNETDIRLWGPYRAKSTLYQRAVGDERAASSYHDGDAPFLDGKAKMLLTGQFLARRQRTVEV